MISKIQTQAFKKKTNKRTNQFDDPPTPLVLQKGSFSPQQLDPYKQKQTNCLNY